MPDKDNLNWWEFGLTILIVLIIGAELVLAIYGIKESKQQAALLSALKENASKQTALLDRLIQNEGNAAQALKSLNEQFTTSLDRARETNKALNAQLKILRDEQERQLAERKRKPHLELRIGDVLLLGPTRAVPSKEFSATTAKWDLVLKNAGDLKATDGIIRVLTDSNDVLLESSIPSQPLPDPLGTPGRAIIMHFPSLRPNAGLRFTVTAQYPKTQKQFTIIFNCDADEIATATPLGTIIVIPPPE